MLDLLALEETQAAIDAIGQAGRKQGMLEHPRLGIGAIEQRNLAAGKAVAGQCPDLVDDPARLVEVGMCLEDPQRLASAGIGPQVLAQAVFVVLDDGVGGVEDVAVRAVVLFEPDDVGDLELALEVAHVADFGTAEGVDRLVVVADREHRRAFAGQQLQPAVLEHVGILELIDQNLAKALLIVAAQRLVARQ